jgi:hypothetical protein
MTDLEKILRKETDSLRLAYLTKTELYAEASFKLAVERGKWKEVDWARFLGVETEITNPGSSMEFIGFKRGFYNTSAARTYSKLRSSYYIIRSNGYEAYLDKELKYATLHYENSLTKLMNRIVAKGLDVSKMTVESNSIGININIVLTDGEKSVKAWTIIAEGPIQRPHYRYLVK